jgi:hypothetical protein
MNIYYSYLDTKIQYIMGKRYATSYNMFIKRLQRDMERMKGVLFVDGDDHAGPRWTHPEAIPTEVTPFSLC